jgi:hypothetical protein
MAITIREEQDASSNSAALSFTTGAGMLTTDKLVLVQANDFYTTASMTTPTGTAGTSWTLQTTVDGGGNAVHTKVWTSDVAAAGAQTVVVNNTTTDEERYAALFVLTGAASGIDGVASTASGTASTSHVAPSVTPTSGQSDDLLICLFCSPVVAAFGTAPTYTMPGGMTAYTEQNVGTYITYRAASQILSSSGATGAKTATASASLTFQTTSFLVKSAAVPTVSPPPYSGLLVSRLRPYFG